MDDFIKDKSIFQYLKRIRIYILRVLSWKLLWLKKWFVCCIEDFYNKSFHVQILKAAGHFHFFILIIFFLSIIISPFSLLLRRQRERWKWRTNCSFSWHYHFNILKRFPNEHSSLVFADPSKQFPTTSPLYTRSSITDANSTQI